VRPAGEAKNIRLEVRGLSAAVVSGDGDRLQQVVWNLLANSVKFTPPGGHIVIELAESTGHIEIRVTDTGIGIDAEFLPHVFDRFRQADTSRTRVHGGLGLGLAIVRHLVESHGGTVHAHSSGGEQGSTFVVRLPLKPAFNAASRHATN
jgi:signal transduction histidine kinase